MLEEDGPAQNARAVDRGRDRRVRRQAGHERGRPAAAADAARRSAMPAPVVVLREGRRLERTVRCRREYPEPRARVSVSTISRRIPANSLIPFLQRSSVLSRDGWRVPPVQELRIALPLSRFDPSWSSDSELPSQPPRQSSRYRRRGTALDLIVPRSNDRHDRPSSSVPVSPRGSSAQLFRCLGRRPSKEDRE